MVFSLVDQYISDTCTRVLLVSILRQYNKLSLALMPAAALDDRDDRGGSEKNVGLSPYISSSQHKILKMQYDLYHPQNYFFKESFLYARPCAFEKKVF